MVEPDFRLFLMCPCIFAALPTITSSIFHYLNNPWLFSPILAIFLPFFSLLEDSEPILSFSLKTSALMIKCFNLSYITDSHVGGFSANTISKVKFVKISCPPL